MEKLITCIIIAGIFCVAEWMREIYSFKITRYHVTSKKLTGLKRERKVIVLSDLHNNCYGKENRKLLKAIENEKPDIIVIAGDMLVGKQGESVEAAEKFVSELPKIAPVYYENGNHEQRMKEYTEKYGDVYEKYKGELVRHGVHFLENESVELLWDEVPVRIHGIEIPSTCYQRMKKIFSRGRKWKL